MGFHLGWPNPVALVLWRSVVVMQLCCLRAEVTLGGQTAALATATYPHCFCPDTQLLRVCVIPQQLLSV